MGGNEHPHSTHPSASPDPVLPAVNPAIDEHASPESGLPFPIVCVGASAGGLNAVSDLLRALPDDLDMGFVVIQHLDPSHASMLPEILARASPLPVVEVEDRMPVEPRRVHVIPPGKTLVLGDGLLQLAPRTEMRGQHRPIDHFMRSLAEEHGDKAIGVILSGSGNDGVLGMQEIKAAGGITFAQDDSAEHTSMPRSVVAAGASDYVLPAGQIGAEIGRIGHHPYVVPAGETRPDEVPDQPAVDDVIGLLKQATGVDFTHYKRNTLRRRVTRRMLLKKFDSLPDYTRLLRGDAAECAALYNDILISVTSFFRNPDAYEALKTTIFPRLTEGKSRNDAVRVWTLGCATGEEAYSISMTYAEYAEAAGIRTPIQIFATDLNGVGIDKARAGIYSRGVTQDVSPERLRRFFVDADGSYRVGKPIRDTCVFARQNAVTDPPFSRMDLVVCRNLLIYLEPVLQQKLIPMLYYALHPWGALWLGQSETVGSLRDLFEVASAKHKFYLKKPGAKAALASFGFATRPSESMIAALRSSEARPSVMRSPDPTRDAERILLARYAPAGVLVGDDLEIIQFRGDTGPYLAPAPGRASLNLLKMLRDGLLAGVRSAIQKARLESAPARVEDLRVKGDSEPRKVDVVVIPVQSNGPKEMNFLVLFEPPASAPADTMARPASADDQLSGEARDAEIERLQTELQATREHLQSVIEQQDASNEELQSANEEIQSANEELQSINEELETSKEEIESTNEELSTVNDELQHRNLELTQSNNDMLNLLNSVQLGILILGRDLRIRRFTPPADRMLNLMPSDVGRPVTDVKLMLDIPHLERQLLEVIDTVTVREQEVQDREGRWYSVRMRPYRTLENRIDGAVVVLVDIGNVKRAELALRESEQRFKVLADSAPVLIWVMDLEGAQFVNQAYADFVGVPEARLQRFDWTQFIHPHDQESYLGTYLDAFGRKAGFAVQVRMRRADGVYRWMKAVATPRLDSSGEFVGMVGCTLDISDLKEAEQSLVEADRSKDEFLAMLSHELRNPLAALRNAMHLLSRPGTTDSTIQQAKGIMERQVRNMVRMVDDLLDAARIAHGRIRLHKERLDIVAAVKQVVMASAHERNANSQSLELDLPNEPVHVEADPARLDQIISNLLDNASKFSPRNTRIWVSVRPDQAAPEWVEIRVRDEGKGIDPEFLPRIFDLFVQGDSSIEQSKSGMGIGLNLTMNLVQMHGGMIEARSAGPSQGSQFIVRLPVAQTHAPAKDLPEAAEPGQPHASHRVLVVEDNDDERDMLASMLSLAGHQVESAGDGLRAIEMAKSFRPHLILLDIGLPGLSGIEVAKRLRAEPELQKTMLIALTGYGSDEDMRRSMQAGLDRHVTKPVDPLKLLALIASSRANLQR